MMITNFHDYDDRLSLNRFSLNGPTVALHLAQELPDTVVRSMLPRNSTSILYINDISRLFRIRKL